MVDLTASGLENIQAALKQARTKTVSLEGPEERGQFLGELIKARTTPKGALTGLTEKGVARRLPWIGEGLGIYDMAKLKSAAEAVQEDAATKEQWDLVKGFFLEMERPETWGYGVTSILAEMPKFWAEIASGGVAYKLGAGLGRKATMAAIKKGVRSSVKRKMLKALGKTAGLAAGATAFSPMAAEDAFRRTMPTMGIGRDEAGEMALIFANTSESFLEAVPEGMLSTAIEVGSEFTGGLLMKLPGFAQVQAAQAAAIHRWLRLNPKRTLDQAMRKLASKTQWHGPIAEMFEERVADVGRATLLGEEFEFPTMRRLTQELAAFSIPGAAKLGLYKAFPEAGDVPRGTQEGEKAPEAPSQAAVGEEMAPEDFAEPEVQGGLAGFLRANEIPEGGATVRAPTEGYQEKLGGLLKKAGAKVLWVDAGRPLSLPAMVPGKAGARGNIVLLDATQPEEALQELVFHELVHVVGEGPVLEAIRSIDPGLVDKAAAEYAQIRQRAQAVGPEGPVKVELDEATLEAEGAAYLSQKLAGGLRDLMERQGGLEQAIRADMSFGKKILQAVAELLNRLGVPVTSPLRRAVQEWGNRVAVTDMERLVAEEAWLPVAEAIRDALSGAVSAVSEKAEAEAAQEEKAAEAPTEAPAEKAEKEAPETGEGPAGQPVSAQAGRGPSAPGEREAEPAQEKPKKVSGKQAKRARQKAGRAEARAKKAAEKEAAKPKPKRRKPRLPRQRALAGELGFEAYVRAGGGLLHDQDTAGLYPTMEDQKGPLSYLGPIVRPKGSGRGAQVDMLGEAAAEMGWFKKRPTVREVLDALSEDIPHPEHAPEPTAEEVARGPSLDVIDTKEAELPPTNEFWESLPDEDARFAARDPLGFYSVLRQAIEDNVGKKGATADRLRALKTKGLFTDEEWLWAEMDDLLRGKKGRVTREELDAWLDAHETTVQERVYGGEGRTFRFNEIQEYERAIMAAERRGDFDEAESLTREMEEWGGRPGTTEEGDPARHGEWQLPGGENYREITLTLPSVSAQGKAKIWAWARAEGHDPNTFSIKELERLNAPQEILDAFAYYMFPGTRHPRAPSEFTSHAFDDPNIIAWVRFNERTLPDGRRVLFVEEIQSDWHQEGRKKGYRDSAVEAQVQELIRKRDAADLKMREASPGRFDPPPPALREEFNRLQDQITELTGGDYFHAEGVPDAPFKTSWPTLALKRMVRWASENNFDAVGWTTGQQQFERYGSPEIAWVREEHAWFVDATEQRGGYHPDVGDIGEAARARGILKESGEPTRVTTKEELRAVVASVAREGAFDVDKVTSRVWDRMQTEDAGVSLPRKEGMEDFYDRVLVDSANKLGKKFGTKAEMGSVSTLGAERADPEGMGAIREEELARVHLLPLPPAMQATVREEGFGRFAAAPPVDSPAFANWFQDSKVVDADGKPLVVYHGRHDESVYEQDEPITAFDDSGAAYFTDSPTAAGQYAGARKRWGGEGYAAPGIYPTSSKPGGQSIPVYLSIQNPLIVELDGEHVGSKRSWAIKEARRRGNDGVIFRGGEDTPQEYDPYGTLMPEYGDVYVAFRPEQVKSAIGNTGAFDPTNPDIRFATFAGRPIADTVAFLQDLYGPKHVSTHGIPSEAVTEALIRRFQNMAAPVRNIQSLVTSVGGVVTENEDTYLDMELRKGLTKNQLESVKAHTEKLIRIAARGGLTLEDLEEYIYALHAEERNATILERNPDLGDAGSGMSSEEADQIIAQAEASPKAKHYEQFAREIAAITAETRQTWVDYGLESQEYVDRLSEMWAHYVPLKSDLEAEGAEQILGMPIGRGVKIRGRESRSATGRTTAAANIVEQTLAQLETAYIRGEKNTVGNTFYRFVKRNQEILRGVVEIVRPEKLTKPAYIRTTGKVQQVPDIGLKDSERTFTTKLKGREVYMVFDPRYVNVAKALTSMGAHSQNLANVYVGKYVRLLAGLSTRYNPVFPFFNAIKDAGTAYFHSTEHGIKFANRVLLNIPKAWMALAGKGSAEWQEWAKQYKESGAPIAFLDLAGIQDFARRVKRDFRKIGEKPTPWAKTRDGFVKVLDLVERGNDIIENASRLSYFVEARKAGMSVKRAAIGAKDLTTNFERKGEYGNVINSWWMFANAGIQGNERALRALVKSKAVRRLLMSAIGGAAAIAMMGRFLGGDDDDGIPYWDKIPNWEKRTHLIFMIPGTNGDRVSIPMPWVYNWFLSIGTFTSDMVAGKISPAEVVGEITLGAMDTFNPFGGSSDALEAIMPTPIDPFYQITTNRDWTGKAIAPTQYPGDVRPDSQRYWPDATYAAKAVTRWMNSATGGDRAEPGWADVSPESLEHLTAFATGGLGRFFGRLYNLGEHGFKGEVPDVYEVPLVRRLYRQKSPFVDRSLFKENYEHLKRVKMRLDNLEGEDATAYRQAHAQELALILQAKLVEKAARRKKKVEDDGGKVEEAMGPRYRAFNKRFLEVRR